MMQCSGQDGSRADQSHEKENQKRKRQGSKPPSGSGSAEAGSKGGKGGGTGDSKGKGKGSQKEIKILPAIETFLTEHNVQCKRFRVQRTFRSIQFGQMKSRA